MSTLQRRRGIALLALAGFFLATYLYLYSRGFYGELACGAGGGCSLVQGSVYSVFLGFPVAGWGLVWYAAVLLVSLLSVMTGAGASSWVPRVLLVLAFGGLGFTIYLTSIELFVLHAICRWCVGSAVLSLLIFALALPELRVLRGSTAA